MTNATSLEVAMNIMNKQVSDYDISDLMDIETQAECFRELVGIWASRKPGYSLVSMCKDMTEFMEAALVIAAKKKGHA